MICNGNILPRHTPMYTYFATLAFFTVHEHGTVASIRALLLHCTSYSFPRFTVTPKTHCDIMRLQSLAAAAAAGCVMNTTPFGSNSFRARSVMGWRHRGTSDFLHLAATGTAALSEEARVRLPPRSEMPQIPSMNELEQVLTRYYDIFRFGVNDDLYYYTVSSGPMSCSVAVLPHIRSAHDIYRERRRAEDQQPIGLILRTGETLKCDPLVSAGWW